MSFPADSKAQSGVLPQAHPINVVPGPRMYVLNGQGSDSELHLGGRRKSTKLRRLLRGLLFISAFLFLGRFVYNIAGGWFSGDSDFDMHNNDWHYDVPADLPLESCVQGDKWNIEEHDGGGFWHRASTSFDIPVSADNIFLLSRGWLSAGLVEIKTSADQSKETVTFDIVAEYHREYIRNLAKACVASREGNQHGVGIFTPSWRSGRHPHGREDRMIILTTITLPEGVTIKGLETDVPNTSQTVRHLRSKVNFNNLALKGSNSPIFVDAVSATKGSLTTSNGIIRGSFNTTTSLHLKTSNSPIEIEVALASDSTEPVLEARTSNGKIDARLSLTSSSGTGGKFDITTTTSNSGLFVEFKDAPVNSNLSLEAKTSNGPAHVTLHPSYEGKYDIETSSWFKADINFLPGDDPSGNHRTRGTRMERAKSNHVFGTTSWSEDGKKAGKVNIHTSNSQVVLDILGV